MANFFEDNEDLQFLFGHLGMEEIAAIQEDGFSHADGCPYAPRDADDAVDNYRRILGIVGEVAAGTIAPRADRIDRDGNILNADGTVTLNEAMRENLTALAQADLMGFTLPRRYGGLNCPNVIYTMAIEIVSRADASLMNLFGLQGIAETVNAFADPAIKDEYLPRFADGELTGAMALTEPDAGSDLQAVTLRAWQDDDGQWRLTGVKRFITNGCGEVLLTLARSERETTDGRGLSLFLVERGPRLKVRRLEGKLGIHGSPTCELVYDDAPATLIGQRQLGLIRYVWSLMNGARVGIAAQSLGIAEAAFRVARRYAHTRRQFGKPIEKLPAIAEMVSDMKITIEAARAITYETSRVCDLENNNLRVLETDPPDDPAELKRRKGDARTYKRLNGMLTPIAKYYASEMCVRVANDALQVLGGSGYMTDYPVERHLRDARITTIYEGTTQLQIVSAVRAVCGSAFERYVDELEKTGYEDEALKALKRKLDEGKQLVLQGVAFVKEQDGGYMDLCGRKLVDAATAVMIGHLLLRQAAANDRKRLVARRFIDTNMACVRRDLALVESGDRMVLSEFETLACPVPAAS
ncbi:MAG: acyl-CoA dehydrogenase family protein [Planctomycetota bacterium]|jgi:alkylation response protein AidB-like acyl-CoA dehydrogenase